MGIKHADNFFLHASRGGISNARTLHVFGVRPGVDTNRATIWRGPTVLRPYPPNSGLSMTVVSDSAADTVAGTGTRVLQVITLDENLLETTHFIDMNGTTPVAIPGLVSRVNRVQSWENGSNFTNVGNITIASGGTTYEYMPAGIGRAETAVYSVPSNSDAFFVRFGVGVGEGKNAKFELYFRNGVLQHRILVHAEFIFENFVDIPLPTNPQAPATTDIEFVTFKVGGGANIDASCSFDLVFIDK